MPNYSTWLNVPQAVVLEATKNIELALGLTSEKPALLIVKANHLVARTVIPLEAKAGEEQWDVPLEKFEEAKEQAKTAMRANSHYLEAQQRVLWRLVAGVWTKARRRPGGPYEDVDPVEYTVAELRRLDAIDKRARTVILFDLLINVYEYVESLTGEPVRLAGVSRLQRQEPASTGAREVGEYGRSSTESRRLGAVEVGVGTSKAYPPAPSCYKYSEDSSVGFAV